MHIVDDGKIEVAVPLESGFGVASTYTLWLGVCYVERAVAFPGRGGANAWIAARFKTRASPNPSLDLGEKHKSSGQSTHSAAVLGHANPHVAR